MKYLIKPEISEEVKKNTVVVESFEIEKPVVNSGVIISPNHVLTAAHCLVGKTYIIKGNKQYEVIDACPILPSCGIALLTLKEPVFHQPIMKICQKVNPGEILFWVTLTFGKIQETIFYGHLATSVSHEDGLTYYYIYGGLCHGMSGSGVYNNKGELVGMLTMIERIPDENENLILGLAVPIEYFLPLIALSRDDLLIKPKEESEKKQAKTAKSK